MDLFWIQWEAHGGSSYRTKKNFPFLYLTAAITILFTVHNEKGPSMKAWAYSWANLPASDKAEYVKKAKQVREGTLKVENEKDKKRLAKKLISQLRTIVSKPRIKLSSPLKPIFSAECRLLNKARFYPPSTEWHLLEAATWTIPSDKLESEIRDITVSQYLLDWANRARLNKETVAILANSSYLDVADVALLEQHKIVEMGITQQFLWLGVFGKVVSQDPRTGCVYHYSHNTNSSPLLQQLVEIPGIQLLCYQVIVLHFTPELGKWSTFFLTYT